jgi:hypothetical protein
MRTLPEILGIERMEFPRFDGTDRRTGVSKPNGQSTTTVYENANRTRAITTTTATGAVLASRAYTYQSAEVTLDDQALRATMTDQSGVTLNSASATTTRSAAC